jgi:hypothetical protein
MLENDNEHPTKTLGYNAQMQTKDSYRVVGEMHTSRRTKNRIFRYSPLFLLKVTISVNVQHLVILIGAC